MLLRCALYPFQWEAGERERFDIVFVAAFVEDADRAVFQYGQARIGTRTRVEQSAIGPGFAAVGAGANR